MKIHIYIYTNKDTSEKRIVADSNISEVGLPYFRFSAIVFGSIWWINFSDLNIKINPLHFIKNIMRVFPTSKLLAPFLLPPQVNEHAEETYRKDLESLYCIPRNG